MTRERWLVLYDMLEDMDRETPWGSENQALIAFLKCLLIEIKPDSKDKWIQETSTGR